MTDTKIILMDYVGNRLLRSVTVGVSQDSTGTQFSMEGVHWSCSECRRPEQSDNSNPDTSVEENLMMLPHGVLKLIRTISEDNSLQTIACGVDRTKKMACHCKWFEIDPRTSSIEEHQDAINAIDFDCIDSSMSRFFTPINDAAGSGGLNDSLFFRTIDQTFETNDQALDDAHSHSRLAASIDSLLREVNSHQCKAKWD